jgi:hypothetical protein
MYQRHKSFTQQQAQSTAGSVNSRLSQQQAQSTAGSVNSRLSQQQAQSTAGLDSLLELP